MSTKTQIAAVLVALALIGGVTYYQLAQNSPTPKETTVVPKSAGPGDPAAVASPAPADRSAESAKIIDAIFDRMESRREHAKTLQIFFRVEKVMQKGIFAGLLNEPSGAVDGDVKLSREYRITIDNESGSVRMENDGDDYFPTEGRAEGGGARIAVLHNSTQRYLSQLRGSYHGTISRTKDIFDGDENGPPMCAGFLPFSKFSRPDLELARRERDAQGRDIAVIVNTEYANQPGSVKYEFYYDVARDYIPVRVVLSHADGQMRGESEVEYREDPTVGWLPTRGKVRWLDNETGKTVTSSAVIAVTEVKINEPLPEGIFDLKFPPGTDVNDKIAGTLYTEGAIPPDVRPDAAAAVRRLDAGVTANVGIAKPESAITTPSLPTTGK